MYTFWIESEDGTRIYSTATYEHKAEATDWAFDALATLAGSYSNLRTTKMKCGVEEVKE